MQLKKSIKNVTQNISKILIFVSKVVDVIKWITATQKNIYLWLLKTVVGMSKVAVKWLSIDRGLIGLCVGCSHIFFRILRSGCTTQAGQTHTHCRNVCIVFVMSIIYFVSVFLTTITSAGLSRCGAQCKTWARGPMQDLCAGPLWTVILWRYRVQSTVLRSW